jgi:hypothetical protein
MRVITLGALIAFSCWAQTKAEPPSKEEISELLAKADEKVTLFDEAVQRVKQDLEKQQPDLLRKDFNAATGAHRIIRGLQSDGPSAYGLVGLIATLDDVTLNAAKTATGLLLANNGTIKSTETQAKLTLLWSAQNGVYDISELIMHATLRLVQVEEDLLGEITSRKK